eukprot:TRINITY_DN1449_c0_g1_i4.p2 TRINITY_DN1449_c0_g1~~TRINITY_DN1449_c0_g1_i4.p2  ORF type:complete len:937 (-),score=231.84 TRINITY_DN1449_c0_g1_i4:3423-6233(-)
MQALPAKDQAVFRSIVKFYETKQYKKGIKAADSILKKHPEHGETLCMKGLTLSYLDRKEEAYELVRKGLKHDLRSHVCWHVYGLLYRQDRDYFEAVKCYKTALRIDPENIQILRDLSLLQIHRRDVTGFAETRRKLLQLKPSNRLNWVGYAIAEHLCKSHEFAWTCIDNYENSFKDQDTVPEYENSELHMYKASIMEEAGKFEEALECCRQHESKIVDKFGLYEMKGRLLMFLGRLEESSEMYKKLVSMNTEHHVYVLALMATKPEFQSFWPALPAPPSKDGKDVPCTVNSFPDTLHPLGMPVWGWLPPEHAINPNKRIVIGRKQHKRPLESIAPMAPPTEDQEEQVVQFFKDLLNEHGKSDTLMRLPLYFLSGKRFRASLDDYLRTRLRKGVPSLFRMVRSLYFQTGKADIIEDLLLQYVKNLKEPISWFGPKEGGDSKPPTVEEEEPPSSLLFTLMVLGEHYDFIGETSKALEFINEAIEHTPTLVEIYFSKARVYRHAGDLETAAKVAEEVRTMDLADRFLNTKSVRAMLRLDDTQGGMEKALLFSREPNSQEASNLHDMQCMWYESHVGRSYCRQKKYGKALKQFHHTFKHFSDISEDQFDFHNYSLRKSTLQAYVNMLRFQERLYSHKFYRRAAKDAIRIYTEIFDAKARGEKIGGAVEGGDGEEDESKMTAEEKKKAKFKKKREAEKAEKEKKAKETEAANSSNKNVKPKKVDEDPDGEKLLKEDPMEQAGKLVKNLQLYSSRDAATHTLTYEVFSRQGKLLPCLQALRQLWHLSGNSKNDVPYYKLSASLSHFCFAMDLESESIPKAVKEVVLAEIAPILKKGDESPFGSVADMRKAANALVDSVENRIKSGKEIALVEVLYGLKCLKAAGRDDKCKAFLEAWTPDANWFEIKECKKLLEYLASTYGKDSKALERFKTRCKEVFPLSTF